MSLRHYALACAVLALGTPALTQDLAAQESAFELELEGGPVWQTRNDVEIPNDGSASRFSLVDVLGKGPWIGGRVYLSWNVSERHGVRLLYAPLSITDTGPLPGPVSFAGESYDGAAPVEATYQFNSYRASYRWRWRESERLALWLGFTAKIRDADIALRQGATASHKEDFGFVPLLHVAGEWRANSVAFLSFDADGLAGGPGRAIDAALKAGLRVGERTSLRVGYRTVEGGADVDEVYTFAWLHSLAASVHRRF